jgi:hypothetical protein
MYVMYVCTYVRMVGKEAKSYQNKQYPPYKND